MGDHGRKAGNLTVLHLQMEKSIRRSFDKRLQPGNYSNLFSILNGIRMNQLPFESLMEIFVLRNVKFAQMIVNMYWYGVEHKKNTFMMSNMQPPLKTIDFMSFPIDNRFVVNQVDYDDRNWEEVKAPVLM